MRQIMDKRIYKKIEEIRTYMIKNSLVRKTKSLKEKIETLDSMIRELENILESEDEINKKKLDSRNVVKDLY